MLDTIAAISSPVGPGGICVVRVSGPAALEILPKIFVRARQHSPYRSHKIYFGRIVDPEGGQGLDQVLVSVMLAPKSYTTEDVVEISCHAGYIAVRRILELLITNGARLAEAGEFTKRAFLNGRIDLTQAEAVADLIGARSEADLANAVAQLEGGLGQTIAQIAKGLEDLIVALEAEIDEEDTEPMAADQLADRIQQLSAQVAELIASADYGRILKQGLAVAIVGRPNVGKSSLLNYILQQDRAIVTDIPGTTRDIIEADVHIRGIAIRFIDTAGIREGGDLVERAGIARSVDSLGQADIVIFVLDASCLPSTQDREIFALVSGKNHILVGNKCDQACPGFVEQVEKLFGSAPILLSALEQSGLPGVEDELYERFLGDAKLGTGRHIVTNLRHLSALEATDTDLEEGLIANRMGMLDGVAESLISARRQLGTISGEFLAEDIVDRIFAEYCVGK